MSKEIRVLGSSRPATVDDDDFEWVSKFAWREYKGYAITQIAGKWVEMGTLVYFMHNRIIPMTENLFYDAKGEGN